MFHLLSHVLFVSWPAIRKSCRSAHSLSLNEAKDYLCLRCQRRKGARWAHEHDLKLYGIKHIFLFKLSLISSLSSFRPVFPSPLITSCQQPSVTEAFTAGPTCWWLLLRNPSEKCTAESKKEADKQTWKEVEKMSARNREVEMKERALDKKKRGLLGTGSEENPTVKIKQL